MGNDLETVKTLLSDFLVFIDKRTTLFLVINEKVFPKILEWNLIIWKNRWQISDEKTNDFIRWFELSKTSESTILKIGRRAIKEDQYLFTEFFLKSFRKHLEACKKESIRSKTGTRYYVTYLFDFLFKLIIEFEETENLGEKEYLWSNIPAEWKITKGNLEDEANIFAKITLNEFLDWAINRVQMGKDFDPLLNDLSVNLFPEVEPRTWAIILTFCFLAFDPSNRVKSIIEQPWSFGYDFSATAFTLSEGETLEQKLRTMGLEKEAETKIRTQKTYELGILLFSNVFEKNLVSKYAEEASNLKYAEDSAKERKRVAILKILNDILAVLNMGKK